MDTFGWQKSSFSSGDGNTNCIEVAAEGATGALHLRESDEPSAIMTPRAPALHALLAHLKARGAATS